jgi:hypothetical protein
LAEEVVRAKRFEIVSDDNEVRGILGSLPDGAVGLHLFDESGQVKLSLSVLYEKDGAPVVYLRDSAGVIRLQLQVGPQDVATLGINDSDEHLRVIAGTDREGNSQFGYEDREGNQHRL